MKWLLMTGSTLNTNHSDTGVFNGKIDDMFIYDRALTVTEVNELYNIPEPCTLLLFGLGGLLIRKR